MQETRGTWTDLIAGVGLEIAEVFDQGQEEYIPGLGNVIQSKTGDGAQKNITGKTGVGEIQQFDDGDNVPGGRRYKTYTTSIVWNNYGKFIDVTKNAISDREYSAELSEMKDLSVGANFSQDASAMQLFNGGFATTRDVNGYRMTFYGDGVPIFSTVHPTTVPGGSTSSNASSTGIKFNYDNLETAYVALLEQKTDDGLPMSLMGKPMIVLPPTLLKEGEEITQSVLDPSTANNAINVYKNGLKCDMAMSVHLANTNGGSDTAWYITVPQRARLVHYTRQSPSLEQDTNIKNKVVTFTVDARWADAEEDWKRTWASKGDLAAYSS